MDPVAHPPHLCNATQSCSLWKIHLHNPYRTQRLQYGGEVDVWSAGCIFAELLLGAPLYPFEAEIDLIFQIFKDCGTPDRAKWPEVVNLAGWESVRKGSTQSHLEQRLFNRVLQKRPVRACRLAVGLSARHGHPAQGAWVCAGGNER
jgi:serine/threonine protein kinase